MLEQIKQLLQAWNQETGQDLHPRAGERIFYQFLKADYTPDDLRCVLVWLKWRNKQSNFKRSLNLRLVLHPYSEAPFEQFAIDLSEARGWERNRRPAKTERDKVLEVFRQTPIEERQKPVKSLNDLFKQMRDQTNQQ